MAKAELRWQFILDQIPNPSSEKFVFVEDEHLSNENKLRVQNLTFFNDKT